MENAIIKHIVVNISSDERAMLEESIINERYNTQEWIRIVKKIEDLTSTNTLCLPYVNAVVDFSQLILTTIGIDNACRYFSNLCSQYHRLQGVNYDSSAIAQKYILRFNQQKRSLPLSTRPGDPSEYVNNRLIGIYPRETTSKDAQTILNAFGEASDTLKSCIESLKDYDLPYYENMTPEKVRHSLNILVDRGMESINALIEEKNGLSQNTSVEETKTDDGIGIND